MIVAFDNTFLSLVFYNDAIPRPNPETGKPVEHCDLRINALIDEHSTRNDTILIPTPCLTELLVVVPDFSKILNEIDKLASFEIASFDVRAAIDLAAENRRVHRSGQKRGGVQASWNEIKFDRQIAMIAKVNNAQVFYTDDKTQSTFAKQIGLKVKHTWDLDLPAKYAQTDMLDDNE